MLGNMGIKNISTGGVMIEKSYSFVGADAERTIKSYNADIVFFSCRSLSEDGYMCDNSFEENSLKRAMLNHAKKKVFLCDSSKLNRTSLNNLCHISEVDEIICEKELPENLKMMLKDSYR